MKLSTSLLFISWIPMLQLLLFLFEKGFIWSFLISIVLSIFGVWLLIKPKDSMLYQWVFGFFLLFGIPVLSRISKSFDYHLPLIVTPISALLLCRAIFLVWKEVRKGDKPYIPVLKFILASIFLLWQLNMGFHLFYELPFIMYSIYFQHNIPFYIKAFGTFQLLLSIFYVTLNLLFFGWIFLKGKFKERQPLFFPGTGLLVILSSFVLLFVLFNIVQLLPIHPQCLDYPLHYLTLIPISFATVLGPVLMIAVVLVVLGGILSFFKKALTQTRFPGVVRKKGMVIALAAVILYVLLFKTLWPFQDPSLGILFGVVKNRVERPVEEWRAIHAASYIEFHLHGSRAIGLLIDKLDSDEKSIRKFSAEFLGFIGDERAVEPLIKTLEDWDKGVRRNAADALARIKDPRGVKPMVEFLEKDDLHYNAYVMLWELGKWGDPRFIEPLLKKLDDDDEVLRKSIVRALEYFKDARVIERLIKQLKKEKSSEVKSSINYVLRRIYQGEEETFRAALKGMTEEDFQGEEDKSAEWWQQWWDQNREYFIKKWVTN